MTRNRILLAIILTFIACTCTHAAGKITVDPNTPEAQAAKEEANAKTDERLAQKVTYEAQRKMVSEILADLTKQTGVTFKAGYNLIDWQVRDRRMNIFAKDIKLADLMSSIARVMKFKWSKSEEVNPPTYRLYMDRKTLLDAESQRQREEQRLADEQAKLRKKTLDEFANVDKLSPQDLAKLKKDSPFLYLTATTGIAKSLGGFFSTVPAASEALATGQPLTMSAAALNPASQQAMLQAMQSIWKLNAIEQSNTPFPQELVDNIGKVTLEINRSQEELKGRPEASILLGNINIWYGDKSVDLPMIDPDSNIAKLVGKLAIQSMEENRPIHEITKDQQQLQSEAMAAMMSDIKKMQPAEPEPEHPDDPKLHEKIKLEPENNMIEQVEKAFAKASGLVIVSDQFGRQRIDFAAIKGEYELKDGLDKFENLFSYNWELHSSTIELRDKQWFRKRTLQIPEAWLEDWRQTLKKTGTLDIDDLSQIAMLTPEQLEQNIAPDGVLSRASHTGNIYANREVLRLYASLTASQQALIFTQLGLDLRSLSQNQWAYAQKLVVRVDTPDNANLPVILTGIKKQEGKHFAYIFTMSVSKDVPDVTWSFNTPEYHEEVIQPIPKKQPEEQKQAKPEK